LEDLSMNFISFMVLLIVAAICGSIGAALAGHNTRGCLTSIIIGFIGAIIGTWLSRELGIGDIFYWYRIPIIWSIIGAAIFVAVITAMTGGKRSKRKK